MRAKLCILVPVDIAYLTMRADPNFAPAGYRIVPFSDRRGLRRHGSFFDVVRLYRALARERPDIILQFVGSAHTGIAALYARRHGCKMIWRVTNDPSVEPSTVSWRQPHLRLERLFLDFGIRHATLILAQTEYQRARLAEAFPNAPVQVLPNFHPTPPDCGRNAWMRRVPVVSLRVDPDELLSTGGLGAVTGDEDTLYERVAALLADPDRCAAIGARAAMRSSITRNRTSRRWPGCYTSAAASRAI